MGRPETGPWERKPGGNELFEQPLAWSALCWARCLQQRTGPCGSGKGPDSCVSLPHSSENRCITGIFFPRDPRDQTGRRGAVEPVGGLLACECVCVSVWGYKWSQEEVFVVLPHGKRLVCPSEAPGDIYLSSTTSREVSPPLCFQFQT